MITENKAAQKDHIKPDKLHSFTNSLILKRATTV